jgi:hypothetical protein
MMREDESEGWGHIARSESGESDAGGNQVETRGRGLKKRERMADDR